MASLNLDSFDSFLRDLSSFLAQKRIFDGISLGIKAFYLLSAFAILLVRFTPELRQRFLAYGARAQDAPDTPEKPKHDQIRILPRSLTASQLLDPLAKLTVPHSWFTHFYVLSVLCSSFQFQHQARSHMSQSARIASLCFLLQSCRRLLECLIYNRQSKSRMWIGHYFIGLAFYLFTNMAMFLDGVDWSFWGEPFVKGRWNPMGPMDYLFTGFFAQASLRQAFSHYYLSTLKKYTLPDSLGFDYWIAPHYTAECVLYGSLAVIAAPPGCILNWNLVCAFIFVAVNLGVTADGTKQWMLSKFPDRKSDIKSRRNVFMLW